MKKHLHKAATLALCALALLLLTGHASAQSRSVKSRPVSDGFLSGDYRFYEYQFESKGVHLIGRGASGLFPPNSSCRPCLLGETVSLISRIVGSDLGLGTATVDGQPYERVYYDGQITFAAAATAVPGTVVVPFTFSGSVIGWSVYDSSKLSDKLFEVPLQGRGLVVVEFGPVYATGLISLNRITYQFQPSPLMGLFKLDSLLPNFPAFRRGK